MTIYEKVGELTVVRCWCGIQFAVPLSLREEQMRQFNNGKRPHGIFCPLGHSFVPLGTPRITEVEKQLARERADHDQTKATLKSAQRTIYIEHEVLKKERAVTKKLKTRVAKGVCPCCHRSFTNMRRHMASKHPEFEK